MTEAMPFLRKIILLSYDPRPFAGGYLLSLDGRIEQAVPSAEGGQQSGGLLFRPRVESRHSLDLQKERGCR